MKPWYFGVAVDHAGFVQHRHLGALDLDGLERRRAGAAVVDGEIDRARVAMHRRQNETPVARGDRPRWCFARLGGGLLLAAASGQREGGAYERKAGDFGGFHRRFGPRFGADFLAGRISCAKEKPTYIADNVKCSTEPPTGFAMGRGTDSAASNTKED